MNMMRTAAVELSSVPVIAYKHRLPKGGAGIKLFRLDCQATAAATIDKRTGGTVPYGDYDKTLFPDDAFTEAVTQVAGLPYGQRQNIVILHPSAGAPCPEPESPSEPTVVPDIVDTDEYRAFLRRYQLDGKMNYARMNKEFIQFASKSKIVQRMISEEASLEDILAHIVKNRAAYLSGKTQSLGGESIQALIETLDEIDPRSAFKELKLHIRQMQTKV